MKKNCLQNVTCPEQNGKFQLISCHTMRSFRNRGASALTRVFLQEDINFLVTNRIPRRYATLLMGWFSRIRSRRLTKISLPAWRLFANDLRLEEAKTRNVVG